MATVTDKRRTFHDLHKSGCFVIPNPWDIGSARYLQHLGFKALATTSAGFAFWQAYPDHAISRDLALAHIQAVVAATDVPVNADLEGGFAHDPAGVAESVRLAVETGVAGLSIEDSTGDKAKPLYDFDHAVARIRAARQAIDRAGGDTLLVGRSEGFVAGAPDLDETIRRLKAYAAAGADCLYAPGIKTREEIAAIVQAVAPKPVNLVIGRPIGLTVAEGYDSIELSKRYTDHHRYSEAELQSFINRCIRRDLEMIVTTEKDAVRFPRLTRVDVPIFFLRVEIEILSGHESWEHCVARICKPQPMLSPARFFA